MPCRPYTLTRKSARHSAKPALCVASGINWTVCSGGKDLGRMILAGAVAAAAMGAMLTLASAAPGQCTVSGYDTFDCDVALDGGGLTFVLPDGRTFAFTLVEEDVGTAFLIDADAEPGQPPEELRDFRAVDDRPGCWMRGEDFELCVLVEQE